MGGGGSEVQWMENKMDSSPASLHHGRTDRQEDCGGLTNGDDHSQHGHRQILAQEEMLASS